MRRYVGKKSFFDRRRNEVINTLSVVEIRTAVTNRFGYVSMNIVRQYSQGEILIDGRGEGSLQVIHNG